MFCMRCVVVPSAEMSRAQTGKGNALWAVLPREAKACPDLPSLSVLFDVHKNAAVPGNRYDKGVSVGHVRHHAV